MKRTRPHDDDTGETTDHAAYRQRTRLRLRSPLPAPSLAGTRLAYHAGDWPPPSPPSHTVSLLRPCAQQCTTWDDAVTAFARLGHGGSVVCKRGDGATRFVGTVPTLRAWWTRTRADRQPVVLEENLWSRHPRSPVACLRYAFGACTHAGAQTELRAGAPDLCWFVDDRTVYVVDWLPRDSTQPI